MKSNIVKFIASCGYAGYIPFASGTFGTMTGVVAVWLVHRFVDINSWDGKFWYLAVTLAFIAVSIPVSTLAEKAFGKKDASQIVIDEAVSFFLTMFWLPFTWKYVLIGFILNRAFDIVKLEPAEFCQRRFPGGYGVVCDDLVAGIQSHIVLRLIILLTGKFLLS
ncbi:MAG: phosphatidylglycerophosphatase A [Candidatus Auribacterota bacterium]|jgi:phosphatidylglycerophosphatase A|nr:phosphatidylglycerophosphatase A [Candidatus Auribacterota bacterium]